jgi:hypothetical protein
MQFGAGPADPLSRQTSVLSGVATGEGLPVQSVSLGAVLEQLVGGSIDLIKLDCEGAEYDILMNSPAAVLEKIDRIVRNTTTMLPPTSTVTHYYLRTRFSGRELEKFLPAAYWLPTPRQGA